MILNLLDRIVDNCMKFKDQSEVKYNEDFIRDRLKYSIQESNLPEFCYRQTLDVTHIPKKLHDLNKKSMIYIPYGASVLCCVANYTDSCMIIEELMEFYVTNCIINDDHICSLLYIDTNLFMSDVKKLFDYGKEDKIQQKLSYSSNIVADKVYSADYIFWDKFDFLNSAYDFDKLYEILSIRCHNCKGNMFFTSKSSFGDLFKENKNRDEEFLRVMGYENRRFGFAELKFKVDSIDYEQLIEDMYKTKE